MITKGELRTTKDHHKLFDDTVNFIPNLEVKTSQAHILVSIRLWMIYR